MSIESAPAPAPAAPAPTQPAVQRSMTDPPVGSPSPVAPTIPLTVDEYQRLLSVQAQLAQIQAEQRAALDEKEQAKLRALAEKGQVEEAFAQFRTTWEAKVAEQATKYTALEGSLLAEKKAATLMQAFAGRQFAGETPEQQSIAADQLRQLLESQYEAARDAAGQIVVRDKVSLRPATDAVKEALASPMYAHFFAATSRGGTGSDGSRPAATMPTTPAAPGTFEDVVAQYKASMAGGGGFGMFGATK